MGLEEKRLPPLSSAIKRLTAVYRDRLEGVERPWRYIGVHPNNKARQRARRRYARFRRRIAETLIR